MTRTNENLKPEPKRDDPDQSKRFEEAARRFDADESNAALERALGALIDPRKRPAQETELHLIGVSLGGVAKLSDGSFWRIAPLDKKILTAWRAGDSVSVGSNSNNMLWSHRLTHRASGTSVGVVPTQVRF